jgi:ribosomal protein S18 acetylase RimI-like enzyme
MTEDQAQLQTLLHNGSFSIRNFDYSNDLPVVMALWQQAGDGIHLGRSDAPGEILKKLQRDPDLFLVAEIDERVIGAVMGGFDGRRGMVYHLAVAKSYRQLGVGDAIMQELEARLRAKGCLKVYLLVTYENQPAMNFYEKRQWQQMKIHIYGKELQ